MLSRSLRLLAAASALALCLADAQAQSPLPRPVPAAGSIVAAKGGEEMRFVREDLWREVPLRQDVVGGDTLRTNAIGTLAIGSFTVLDLERLSPDQRRLFERPADAVGLPTNAELGASLPEPHPSWMTRIVDEWERRYSN